MHRFDVKTINNVELRRKTFKTTLNYKLQWLASIWWQNDHNNAKIRKLSNYDELHGFNVRTIRTTQNSKSDEITMNCIDLTSKRLKQRKTINAIKQRWICTHSTSKRPKCWVTTQNIQNNAKLEKWPKYHELHRLDVKTINNVELRRKTFKTTLNYKSVQNNAKLRKWSKYNELHRFDVKTINNVELRRKTFKTTLNYKSAQTTMTCIDLMTKLS